MIKNRTLHNSIVAALLMTMGLLPITSRAQDRLKTRPGYDHTIRCPKRFPLSEDGSVERQMQADGMRSSITRRQDLPL